MHFLKKSTFGANAQIGNCSLKAKKINLEDLPSANLVGPYSLHIGTDTCICIGVGASPSDAQPSTAFFLTCIWERGGLL